MPGSILCVTYDTTTGRYLVQKAGSAQIADGAITSGLLASGIVGTVHLRDLNVTSAKLATAIIALLGTVADEAITSAKLASGAVGGDRIWDGAIVSAHIGPSVIGGIHILDGSIGGVDLANQAVISAKINTLAVGTPHLAALAVEEAKIASGAVTSGKIGTGIIGDTLLKDFGLLSGKYASGSITEQALVSGISIDIAEVGQEPSYRAAEIISAFQGVQFATSNYFGLAQIASANTMPAVGIAIANIASGSIGTFHHLGRITNPAWDFSGYVGNLVFLGSGQCGSEVTLTAPSTSGECVQRLGKVITPETVFLRPTLQFVQIAE